VIPIKAELIELVFMVSRFLVGLRDGVLNKCNFVVIAVTCL